LVKILIASFSELSGPTSQIAAYLRSLGQKDSNVAFNVANCEDSGWMIVSGRLIQPCHSSLLAL
jgi:hypothetical protein